MPILRPQVTGRVWGQKRDELLAGGAGKKEPTIGSIIKWIPLEIVAAYEFIINAIPANRMKWELGVTLAMIPITGIWIWLGTTNEYTKPRWRQMIMAVVAFIIWIPCTRAEIMNLLTKWETWNCLVSIGLGVLFLSMLDKLLGRLRLQI